MYSATFCTYWHSSTAASLRFAAFRDADVFFDIVSFPRGQNRCQEPTDGYLVYYSMVYYMIVCYNITSYHSVVFYASLSGQPVSPPRGPGDV